MMQPPSDIAIELNLGMVSGFMLQFSGGDNLALRDIIISGYKGLVVFLYSPVWRKEKLGGYCSLAMPTC
jgi:hypothetical protein